MSFTFQPIAAATALAAGLGLPDDRLDLDRASAPAPTQSLSRAESQAEFTVRNMCVLTSGATVAQRTRH